MALGADTQTDTRTHTRIPTRNFKKPGARGLQLRTPGLKIVGADAILKSNLILSIQSLVSIDDKQFQLGSYIHTCTNETHSLTNLQDLIPILAAIIVGT